MANRVFGWVVVSQEQITVSALTANEGGMQLHCDHFRGRRVSW
ncbi:hypothetical protein [Gilliamella sp. W8145]|nr:hypothetical protein [Gilliamella sp. W8145]